VGANPSNRAGTEVEAPLYDLAHRLSAPEHPLTMLHTIRNLLLVGLFAGTSPASVWARQVSSHCRDAARFLEQDRAMIVVTEADTIDDLRSGRRQPGCRITAAATTTNSIADEAVRFYEHVRAAGWTRTPDPRDAPGEAALRFRKGGSDCLFHFYEGVLLLTDAERTVMTAVGRPAGTVRYGVYVTCVAAVGLPGP
jgi:hypothetical protein